MLPLTLAALDPGSARCALVIARHEAPAPLTLLHARVYPVGHLAPRAAPKIVTRKDGTRQVYDLERVSSPEEDSRLISAIMLDIISHGVTDLLIERTDPYLSESANLGAMRAQVKAVSIADRLAARIADRCEVLGIRVATTTDRRGQVHLGIPRVTWLADLRRYGAAHGHPIPQAIGDGAALDPLLRQHLPALFAAPLLDHPPAGQAQSDAPGVEIGDPAAPEAGEPRSKERSPGADLRDAAGLLLSRVLPIPPPAGRAAPPSGPTSPRSPTAQASGPRKRQQTREPGYQARAAELKAKRAAARPPGCTCPPGDGRPRRACAAWPAHQAAALARRTP